MKGVGLSETSEVPWYPLWHISYFELALFRLVFCRMTERIEPSWGRAKDKLLNVHNFYYYHTKINLNANNIMMYMFM